MNILLSQEAMFDLDFSRKKYLKIIKTNKYKMQKLIYLWCNPGEDIKTCFHKFCLEYKCILSGCTAAFLNFLN